jgi:hypothetical protein
MRRHYPPRLTKISLFRDKGAIAQLGERLVCIQEVCGSIPHSSTIFYLEKVSHAKCLIN